MPPQARFRRRSEEGGNWELSFADMMTLILCFFILMVTVSEVDTTQYDKVAESLGQAMGVKEEPKPEPQPAVPSEWRRKLKTLTEVRDEIRARIRGVPDAASLEMRPDAVAVNLRGTVLFALGSAELTPTARDVLERVAEPLMGIPYRVTVEGHTDDIPMRSDHYPSNWELSSARASAVARFLIDRGFPKGHIQVKGLADTRPKAPNRDGQGQAIPDNQAKNRRIVILVEPLESKD